MLFENIIIIYLIMMANKTELSMIGINKLEYDPVRDIHPKAPDLVTFGMELFKSQGWMKRVVLEKVCLLYRLFLDRFRKGFKELIKSCSGGNFHLFIFAKLREGSSFCNTALFVILFREIKEFKKLLSVKPCCITECLKGLFVYLKVDAPGSLLCYNCFKFMFHNNGTSQFYSVYRLNILFRTNDVNSLENVI